MVELIVLFFFQAEAGIRDRNVTGVQTCALPSSVYSSSPANRFASEVRIGSRSASGPSSGSNRCRGTTSTIAPRRAPIAARSLVARRSREILASGLLPAATSASMSRKAVPARDTVSARTRRSSSRAPGCGSDIDGSPPFECAPEGDLVGVLQVPADGKAGGEAAHGDPHGSQEPDEVRRGGFPLNVGVGRDDDLSDRLLGE